MHFFTFMMRNIQNFSARAFGARKSYVHFWSRYAPEKCHFLVDEGFSPFWLSGAFCAVFGAGSCIFFKAYDVKHPKFFCSSLRHSQILSSLLVGMRGKKVLFSSKLFTRILASKCFVQFRVQVHAFFQVFQVFDKKLQKFFCSHLRHSQILITL